MLIMLNIKRGSFKTLKKAVPEPVVAPRHKGQSYFYNSPIMGQCPFRRNVKFHSQDRIH